MSDIAKRDVADDPIDLKLYLDDLKGGSSPSKITEENEEDSDSSYE
jgi:hypothetical protein